MKKMMKCLALAMVVLAVAGTAWCWDFNDHVKMAPNGQGDLLIYPFYAALNGGWETKVSIINTSTNRSVVAHMAFYSAKNSFELLDFFLFLTPTDEWVGTVKYVNGKVVLETTDDSFLTSATPTLTFANSLTTPFQVELKDPLVIGGTACNAKAEAFGNQIGYIKVLEAAHSSANIASSAFVSGGVTYNLNRPPVPKAGLYAAFLTFLGVSNTIFTAGTVNPLVMDGINVLSGHLELRNVTINSSASLNAVALRDYDNQAPVKFGESIGFAASGMVSPAGGTPLCGYAGGAGITAAQANMSALALVDVDANALTNGGCQVGGGPVVGTTTICNPFGPDIASLPGCGCSSPGGFGCQNNSVGEVEAALAKDWLIMPINGKASTIHILTLPTKQSNTSTGVGVPTDCYYVSSPGPFFNENNGLTPRVVQPPAAALRPQTYSPSWDTWGCFSYAGTDYNLSEGSSSVASIFSPSGQPQSLCGEVNLRAGDMGFEEGWAVYNFSPNLVTAGIGTGVYTTRFDTQSNTVVGTYDAMYTGAPVIGTSLHIGADGLTLSSGTYVDGRVIANVNANTTFGDAGDVAYYYYQYWDSANINDVGITGVVANGMGLDEAGFVGVGAGAVAGPAVVGSTIYGNKFAGNRIGFNAWGVAGWPIGAGGIAPGPATAVFDGQTP